MMNAIFEFMAYLLLLGSLALAVVMIILAMCAVASDADEKTEEGLKNNEKGNHCKAGTVSIWT